MRRDPPGGGAPDGGTALQEDPERPVFRGHGPYDYVCVECGNVLAAGDGPGGDEQARADQVRALQDDQRRRLRPQGRDMSPIGFGRMRRKEDARFIRGQGHYVDDVQLPGMLHGAVLRRPFAHARIVSIDTSAALQHPKVHAVITGADLEARGMAWMPTMSADTQAVLATDKVRFQGQEVAFVDRRRSLLGARRAGADRRRVRAAAGRGRRAPGAGARRAGDPRRQRADRQPHLRLGGR